jgi:hypothetical protein
MKANSSITIANLNIKVNNLCNCSLRRALRCIADPFFVVVQYLLHVLDHLIQRLVAFNAAVTSIALHGMGSAVRDDVWESLRRAVRPTGQLIALDFAVPQHNSLLARFAARFSERDERGFLDIYPAHYENFPEFMRNGGLLSWVQQRSQKIEAEYRFWGGTLAVVIIGQSAAGLGRVYAHSARASGLSACVAASSFSGEG